MLPGAVELIVYLYLLSVVYCHVPAPEGLPFLNDYWAAVPAATALPEGPRLRES